MEKAQNTKTKVKLQFPEEEPEDSHETQEPSDSLMSPAIAAKAEENTTDDYGSDDQLIAIINEGAEASPAGESTLLPTPIKSRKSKFHCIYCNLGSILSQKPAYKACPCFCQLGERRRLALEAVKKKKLLTAEIESRERQIAAERKKKTRT